MEACEEAEEDVPWELAGGAALLEPAAPEELDEEELAGFDPADEAALALEEELPELAEADDRLRP